MQNFVEFEQSEELKLGEDPVMHFKELTCMTLTIVKIKIKIRKIHQN